MSVEKVGDEGAESVPTCPWCAEDIESNIVLVRPPERPERRSTTHSWHLHADCAAEWREFVDHLRTVARRGAFRTLVEKPIRRDVNEMVEWAVAPPAPSD